MKKNINLDKTNEMSTKFLSPKSEYNFLREKRSLVTHRHRQEAIDELSKFIDKMSISDQQKKDLLKKVDELKLNHYLESKHRILKNRKAHRLLVATISSILQKRHNLLKEKTKNETVEIERKIGKLIGRQKDAAFSSRLKRKVHETEATFKDLEENLQNAYFFYGWTAIIFVFLFSCLFIAGIILAAVLGTR